MLISSLILSPGLKVTNNLESDLLILEGALLFGIDWAKQTLPLSVSALKLSQFLYFPVDFGTLALTWVVNKIKKSRIDIF